MPINPKYKFLSETGPGGNAFGAGMALWGGPSEAPQRATPYIPGGLTPDIVNAVRAARQTQPAQPAPQVNRPATQPVAPVAPMQPMAQPEQFQYEPMEEFDVNGPYISEQRTTQAGMEGIGSWDSLPMGEQGTKILPPNAMAPVREDEPAQLSNPEIPENFDRTTISQKAQAMGMDPRQLFVALAELSAGLGNIKGQPQQSTARGFYEMQKKYENQDRDNAMRAMPAQIKAGDPLTEQYKQTQIDYLKSKMQPKPAAQPDPLAQQLLQEQIKLTQARRGAFENTQGMPPAVGEERVDTQKPSGAYGEKIQVPGWRKIQNVPAEKTELKHFRDRSSKVPRVIEKINQLKGMIQKHGAFENPYNEAGTMMRQLSNDIKLDLKGPEFKALGVLTGPDMSILEALIPDTSGPQNALRGDASVARSLDMLTQNLNADLDAAARQLGFEKDAEQSTPTTTGTRGLPVWKP